MTANVTSHPACPPVNALNCVDSINLSIEHAIGNADLLRVVLADSRQPVRSQWLYAIAAHVRIEAGDVEYSSGLWGRLPVQALSDADRQAIARQLAAVIRQVASLEQCADHLASVQVDRDYMFGITNRLIAALKTLSKRVQAVWRAGQPTAPAA